MKKKLLLTLICAAFVLGGCGTSATETSGAGSQTAEVSEGETAALEDGAESADSDDALQAAGEGTALEDEESSDEAEAAGAEETSGDGQDSDAETAAVTMQDIYEEITSQVELQSPMLLTDEIMYNYYNIDAADLEEYVFEMSEDATSAEMVVLMKAKDAGTAEQIRENLETELSYKKYELEDYLPEEYEIVNKAQVKTDGVYLWLVVSHSAEEISDIIESYF